MLRSGVSERKQWIGIVLVIGVVLLVADISLTNRVLRVRGDDPKPRQPHEPVIVASAAELRLMEVQAALQQPHQPFLPSTEVPTSSPTNMSLHPRGPLQRGIVLPLFDKIATLGASFIQELRALHVDLPVEVPHCGDLSEGIRQRLVAEDKLVYPHDVCAMAVDMKDPLDASRNWFCDDLAHCQKRFRSFEIKVLAVTLSRFQEVMLLDADALFFHSPMQIWDSRQYRETGTLFFHDRISFETEFLAGKRGSDDTIRAMHEFLSNFDVKPFSKYPVIPRPRATTKSKIKLPFEPSEFLLKSHSWATVTGHQMDSSFLLWNKLRQPRATAILAHFISLRGSYPPSYGDKEFFFQACELAETKYGFSDFAVGTYGTDVRSNGTVLCGDALHYFPESTGNITMGIPLYINSDNILRDLSKEVLQRTLSRSAALYPGNHNDRGLMHVCAFDVNVTNLTHLELDAFTRRQRLFKSVEEWTTPSPVADA
ncbi:TPA: hypothetical protein N0F65_011578 [Lagenidium giganteum]|uniref:Nucleotide-diphospho-sugar transferase domain-containing protein n=1 Tax=Lagenidium giganteum TaxID=4803 RepID=A0AAV2YFI7_9STRA|nr:TPA: hypothetical protein N0F65_011578 [Lagenidium giganteum]